MPFRVQSQRKAFRSALLGFVHSKLLYLLYVLLEALKHWTKPCSKAVVIGAITDLARSKSRLLLENAGKVRKLHLLFI